MTEDQKKQLQQTAWQRRQYILWISEKLEQTDDKLIRKEAAKLLRELMETK